MNATKQDLQALAEDADRRAGLAAYFAEAGPDQEHYRVAMAQWRREAVRLRRRAATAPDAGPARSREAP